MIRVDSEGVPFIVQSMEYLGTTGILVLLFNGTKRTLNKHIVRARGLKEYSYESDFEACNKYVENTYRG